MVDVEGRLSPSYLVEDFEDETLDPRIQDELERLNRASEEINRLELELDDARAVFRQVLTDSTYKLDVLAKKLGTCVEKARPYYDARVRAKEVHVETQKAAYMFERACSMHEAAKEMVQLAEQGYTQREDNSDPAWQEMLNHATMKVNDAESERLENEKEHLRTTQRFKEADDLVQRLQKDLKRSINKSKYSIRRSFLRLSDIANQYELEMLPYFEMKAQINHMMEDRKKNVGMLEESVARSKQSYSDALRSLEEISEAIHQKRLEMRNEAELGVRGSGVGSESPSPPPMRGKQHLSIDGKSIHLAGSNEGSPTTTDIPPYTTSTFTSSQQYHPPSVIYSSPEKARTESYRQAIDARPGTRQQGMTDIGEDLSVNLDDEYKSLPGTAAYSGNDAADNVFTNSTDINHRGSSQNNLKQQGTGPSDSAGSMKKTAKLKGLILTPVGAGLDPLQANVRIQTKPHVAQARPEPTQRQSCNTSDRRRPSQLEASSSQDSDRYRAVTSPTGSESFDRRLLRVPSSSQEFDETSMSDTESITSGPMLDDDQVEFLTMDFSQSKITEQLDTMEYRRLSLPDALCYARKISQSSQDRDDSNRTSTNLMEEVDLDDTSNTVLAEDNAE